MSTRATILIRQESRNAHFRIYHHTDGYPDGIGADIKRVLDKTNSWCACCIANDMLKGLNGFDEHYELTFCQHGDEEYAYLIDCDNKQLTCYKIGWDEFVWRKENIVEIPNNDQ